MRLARFARVRLLRHALPISLLILRKKKTTVLQSIHKHVTLQLENGNKYRKRWAGEGGESSVRYYRSVLVTFGIC